MASSHRRLLISVLATVAVLAGLMRGPVAVIASGGGSRVTTGTPSYPSYPSTPFPQNKQNEPAIAVDLNPNDYNATQTQRILIAGSNDELDLQPCYTTSFSTTYHYQTGSCPFTPGVGVSGVYFSTDGGGTWIQPGYTGYSARDTSATGVMKPDGTFVSPPISPGSGGPIGTLPNYDTHGLVSGGDPGLAVGPKPGSGGFSWSNGSRFYYSNLVSNFPGTATLTSQEGLAVSHTDDLAGAMAGHDSAWSNPSIASGRQNPVLFEDKPAMWADNAASSAYFGRVYVSWTAFRAANAPNPFEPEPIMSAYSTDGGTTWSSPVQISPAADSPSNGRQGSTIRTDSRGDVYIFWEGYTRTTGAVQMMAVSTNGGRTYSRPRPVAAVRDVGVFDPIQGRLLFDGVQGARTDSFPSVDIANGAPSGTGASNQIVLGWSDAGPYANGKAITDPSRANSEETLLTTSRNGGAGWTAPVPASASGDRPDFSAVAISPGGSTVYVTYDAFLQPYQTTQASARNMQGVVRTAAVTAGAIGSFGDQSRGASGDARGSAQNGLTLEFLGDYNYIVADDSSPYAVFNDARNEANCTTVDSYRTAFEAALAAGQAPPPAPDPTTECPPTFGNLDIYS